MEMNKNKLFISKLNLEIIDNSITGIIGNNELFIKENFFDKDTFEEVINEKKYVISLAGEREYLTKTVSDEFFLRKKIINDNDNYIEKIMSALEMVGLNDTYLEKNNNNLSKTEKKLINMALALIVNPDIIILDNIVNNLDKVNKLLIKRIILNLKNKYNKTIIILDNINILYEMCDYFLIKKDDNILLYDSKKNIINNVDLLIENNIEIPFIIKFMHDLENSNREIGEYKNIFDLIKSI